MISKEFLKIIQCTFLHNVIFPFRNYYNRSAKNLPLPDHYVHHVMQQNNKPGKKSGSSAIYRKQTWNITVSYSMDNSMYLASGDRKKLPSVFIIQLRYIIKSRGGGEDPLSIGKSCCIPLYLAYIEGRFRKTRYEYKFLL
jgi:hypothetical protein